MIAFFGQFGILWNKVMGADMRLKYNLTFLFVCLFFWALTTNTYSDNLPVDNAGAYPDGFIENAGQWDGKVLFASKIEGLNLIVANDGIYYDYYQDKELESDDRSFRRTGRVIRMSFSGAIQALKPFGINQNKSRFNIFKSNDPDKWIRNIGSYSSVILQEVYKNIHAELLFVEGYPRYDFLVKPGGDPSAIEINFDGGNAVLNESENCIEFETPFGKVYNGKIFAYQYDGSKKTEIECRLVRKGGGYGFELGDYDRSQTLVIDPLVYSSYFGGSSTDEIRGIKSAGNGEFVVAGWTESSDFHTTPGAYDETFYRDTDIFVSKYFVRGVEGGMVFSTLLGGENFEAATALDLDEAGNIYITGSTNSEDFPLVFPISPEYNDELEVFVSKFNPDGDSLIYSSFFGGRADDKAHAMRVDRYGSVYICGETESRDFPKKTQYNPDIVGLSDIFVTKISPSGAAYEFSTIIGGSAHDRAFALDVDQEGTVYLTGETSSGDFPMKPFRTDWWGRVVDFPYDYVYNGGFDTFLIKLVGNGGQLEFSSYFGGSADDVGKAVLVDDDETVFVAGETLTESGDPQFPLSETSFDVTHNGQRDCFFAKIDKLKQSQRWGRTVTTQDLVFSGFFGGNGNDHISGMMKNPVDGMIYVYGYTNSSNFPVKGGLNGKNSGSYDGYVAKITPLGSDISYSGFYGGNGEDKIYGFDIDERHDFYFAGSTSSDNLETTPNAAQDELAGGAADGFWAKNVISSLMMNGPFGGERYCAGTSVRIGWLANNFTGTQTFTLEMMKESDGEWVVLGSDLSGNSFVWELPIDMPPGEDYYLRIVHESGIYHTIENPFSILAPPSIVNTTYEPAENELCEGSDMRLAVETEGAELTYQWKFNGIVLENETDSVLVLDDLEPEDSGDYSVYVRGRCSPAIESDPVSFVIHPTTQVTTQLKDTTVNIGNPIEICVDAEGHDLFYEWLRNGLTILESADPCLNIQSVASADSAHYQCVVYGTCGRDTTVEMLLSVLKPEGVFDNGYYNSEGLKILSLSKTIGDNTLETEIFSASDMSIQLKIINISGMNTIPTQQYRLHPGNNRIRTGSGNLSSGIYWLSVQSGVQKAVRKFIVIR